MDRVVRPNYILASIETLKDGHNSTCTYNSVSFTTDVGSTS